MKNWMPLLLIGGIGVLIYFMMRGRTAEAAEGARIQPIGGTPGSAGYQWEPERGGWIRPWDVTSFIPASSKPEWKKYVPVPSLIEMGGDRQVATSADMLEESVVAATRERGTMMTSGEFVVQVLLPSGVLTDADVRLFARPVTELGPEIYAEQKRRMAEIEQQLGTETSLGELRNATGRIKKGMYPTTTTTTTTSTAKTTTTRAGLAAIKEAAGW